MTKKEIITAKAKEILAVNPSGVRFSELVRNLQEVFPGEAYGNFTGAIWNLDSRFPTEIYKPARGLFRLTQFKTDEPAETTSEAVESVQTPGRIRESHFYEAFANYLVQDLEECTKAIQLGGSMFGAKWGTPDIFGIFKARESDIFKPALEVVVAEVKTDCSQPITAFGQACAYRLFAHKSYLVIPRDSQKRTSLDWTRFACFLASALSSSTQPTFSYRTSRSGSAQLNMSRTPSTLTLI